LLSWYDRHRRDLPWRRRGSDAYAQWVAEIMLQQTRVPAVLRYYEPFLKRFPSVQSLADADHQSVLKLWEGLGYYRRALHLHRACRELWDRGADIPRTAKELVQLPGVGQYTAAAIASIAFGEPVAAVDGNVTRVIARLRGEPNGAASSEARRTIQREADRLLSRSRPGEFNQAWMDLGSTVCAPRNPDCPKCPLRKECRFGEMSRCGAQAKPTRRSIRPSPTVHLIVVVMRCRGKTLIQRRPEGGLWSGLWEFPTVECSPSAARAPIIRSIVEEAGVHPASHPARIGRIEHSLTHRRLILEVYDVEVEKSSLMIPGRRKSKNKVQKWVSIQRLEELPFSTAQRRAHALLTGCKALRVDHRAVPARSRANFIPCA